MGRQEQKVRTRCANGAAEGLAFVTSEVVHNNDISRHQRRDEDALDIGTEDVTVHRPVEDPGRVDPVVSQRGDKGRGVPVTERGRPRQAPALRCLATERSHVGLHPGLVDEDKPRRVDPALMPLPSLAAALHVGTFALVGHQRLFLKLNPQPLTNRQTVSWLTTTPCSASKS